MPNRPSREAMKGALDTIRRGTANLKALTYAPWVLCLLAVIMVRDRAAELEANDWLGIGSMMVVLPILSRLAQRAITRQRERAEQRVEELVSQRGGFETLASLQESASCYRKIELSPTLRRQIVLAALIRQEEIDQRRLRQRDRAGELVGV